MMKRTFFAVAAMLIASAACADEVESRLDADADGQVYIYNLSGSVEVVGWSDIRLTQRAAG